MAKYIKFDGTTEYQGIPFDEENRIEIVCSEEFGLDNFKDKEIEEADNVSVYELQAGGMGGGADGPMLLMILSPLIAITISVGAIIGKAFFDEIGKHLAQKLLSKYEHLPKVSILTLLDHSWNRVEVIVPENMSAKDCETLSNSLNEFIKNLPESTTSVYLTYDKETKKLVVISQ